MQATLSAIHNRLESAREKHLLKAYALIGGFAVARWGQPRFTDDIDFAIAVCEESREPLAKHLEGTLLLGTIHDPLPASISFIEHTQSGPFQVQLVEFYPAWERLLFDDVQEEVVGSSRLPIVGWRALVLLKLYAGGPHDLRDAEGILAVNAPSSDDLDYLRSKANSLRVNRRLESLLKEQKPS